MLPGIWFVCHPQLGHMRWQFLGQFFGRETHRRDIVDPRLQLVMGRLHELPEGPQAVVHVHHREPRVGLQVALVFLVAESGVEDGDGVVWNR